ncbi:MAG TPA: 6-bladed beta-propeller [Methanobacteriaceae archaeon]|nr:6-bladed beta-propeller [Methanobacteriaceae archaeon]
MRIIQKLIIILFLLSTMTACFRKNINGSNKIDFPISIHLNLSEMISDSMNLSDIADKVEYFPLQTNDSCLMDYFDDFSITKDYYFIQDRTRVIKFTNYGKYLNSLFKVGRGPGEAYARFFTISESEELVYVYDSSINSIKIYNFNGIYIKRLNTPIYPSGYWSYSIGVFNKNLFVHTIQSPLVKYLYSFFDLNTDSIRIVCNNYRAYDKAQRNTKPLILPYDYHFQITDTCVLYKERFCDTIFKVDKNFIQKSRFIVDLGNRKLDWDNWRDHGMFNTSSGPPYGYQIQSFIETKTFLFLVLTSFRENELFAVLNKNTNSLQVFTGKNTDRPFSQIYVKNDLDNLVPFPPMNKKGYLYFYDGCLYSVIESKVFAEAYKNASFDSKRATGYLRNMAEIFSKINEFSNPIIMKVHLK